ncbi:MAG: SPOR domain-containing protein [Peptostreptococcaceae bacterium]
MKTSNGFTKFDTIKEFENWLNKQKVTRKIDGLQVHHMDLPNYSTWEKTDKKVFGSEPELGRTKSLDTYGKNTWGSGASDGHGHYIAQHFNIFPNGKITTGRNLNSTPIGIKGWNTGKICIEIYGDFDKGKDVITKEQKASVIALYALLAKKFKIAIDTNHIRPHCWFTSSGTYLGSYNSNKSAKTCPGTDFMGFGCSKGGFDKFLNLIKNYGKDNTTSNNTTNNITKKVYRVICGSYSKRENADDVIKKLKKLGYSSFIDAFKKDNKNYYRVIAGSYSVKANAEKLVKELKIKGYSPFIIS